MEASSLERLESGVERLLDELSRLKSENSRLQAEVEQLEAGKGLVRDRLDLLISRLEKVGTP